MDWICTENGLVSDLPVAFTLEWYSSELLVKFDVRVHHFGQNIVKQTNKRTVNSNFTILNNQPNSSPNSDWLRSHLMESNPPILSQYTSIRWFRIQSKSKPNRIPVPQCSVNTSLVFVSRVFSDLYRRKKIRIWTLWWVRDYWSQRVSHVPWDLDMILLAFLSVGMYAANTKRKMYQG